MLSHGILLTHKESRRTLLFPVMTLLILKQQIKSYPLLAKVFQQNLIALFYKVKKLFIKFFHWPQLYHDYSYTAQKWSFPLSISSVNVTKFLMKNFNFCAVNHKKLIFPLSISSVNRTESAGNCGFGHIYWRNPNKKLQFLCNVINRRRSCVAEKPRKY